MFNKIRMLFVITVIGVAIYAGVLFGGKLTKAMAATNSDGIPAVGFANPAAIYCADLGYSYEIVTTENGDFGVCTLPDNSACDEWDFLAGKCGAQYSLCAKQGYDLQVRNDGKGFAPEYAVCVGKDGRVVGSVSELAGLFERARKSCSPGQEELRPNPFESAEAEVVEDIDMTNPASFDWRTNGGKNRLTNVRDQGGCGSCWAFSAVGTTEAALNIANNKTGDSYDLSEEYLVSDCHMAYGYQTCCGGWKDIALTYIKNSGISDEACMPYVDGSGCSCGYGTCDSSCAYSTSGKCSDNTCANRCSNWATRLTKIATTGKVSTDREAIKSALIAKGPLAVSLNMSGYWSGDIWRCSNDTSTNHAVVIVGYNNTPGYWWVKNSWGASWNGDGYFKVGYGECAIEKYVYYATADKPIVPTLIQPNGTISDNTPTYKWTSVSGAAKYEILVYQGTTKVFSKEYASTACSGGTCSGTPSNTLVYKAYKWQARAYTGGSWKPWSAWMNFKISGVPTLLQPTGTISIKTPTYKWTSVGGATKYEIQLYKGTTKVYSKIYTSTACPGSTCSGKPSNTLANKTYKWQARAYIGGAWKPWSAWMNFTVAAPALGFNSQFTSDATGWNVHKGAWRIQSGAYTTLGVTNKYASISHVDNYTTLTYVVRLKRAGCITCENYLSILGTPAPLDTKGRWNKEYKFVYTNDGGFSVWKVNGSTITSLLGWTHTAYINKGGWNTLKVTASGSDMWFYINGGLLYAGTNWDFPSGRVGIGMFSDGTSTDKLWVDWAKLATTVADEDQIAEFLMGEELFAGNNTTSP